MNDNYNIYIDIDSILDFRHRTLTAFGFTEETIQEAGWSQRISDSILGVDRFVINALIDTERDALFASCSRTDIVALIYSVYMDGYARGVESGKDISINLDIDIKTIPLDDASIKLLVNSLDVLIPANINIDVVRSFVIEDYDAIIIYNSASLIENIVALEIDHTSRKLFTPFLMDRLVEGITPSKIIAEIIESLSGYIDIDFPPISNFSLIKKIEDT